MPVILFNISWMAYNCLLAVLAVVLGYMFLNTKNKPARFIIGVLWFLFLPNTIYMVTDLLHIIYQWDMAQGWEKVLVLLQFIALQIVALVTFILAFRPFEEILRWFRYTKTKKVAAIVLFNLLISFGIVLGRVERLNSWEVFTAGEKVMQAITNVFTSPELLGLTILFGLFCNFFYFLFRDPIFHFANKLMRNLAT